MLTNDKSKLEKYIQKLEAGILKLMSQYATSSKPFWYWTGADHFEPTNYTQEQNKYGETLYNKAIERLEYKGLVRCVFVKGASNAEYYKLTKKGKEELKTDTSANAPKIKSI